MQGYLPSAGVGRGKKLQGLGLKAEAEQKPVNKSESNYLCSSLSGKRSQAREKCESPLAFPCPCVLFASGSDVSTSRGRYCEDRMSKCSTENENKNMSVNVDCSATRVNPAKIWGDEVVITLQQL